MRILVVVTTLLFLALLDASWNTDDIFSKIIGEVMHEIDFDYGIRSSRGATIEYMKFLYDRLGAVCMNFVPFFGTILNKNVRCEKFKLVKWLKNPGDFAEKGTDVCIVRRYPKARNREPIPVIAKPPDKLLVLAHLQEEGTPLIASSLYFGMLILPNTILLLDEIEAYKGRMKYLRQQVFDIPLRHLPQLSQQPCDSDDLIHELLALSAESGEKIRPSKLPKGINSRVIMAAHRSLSMLGVFSSRFESEMISDKIYICHLTTTIRALFHNPEVKLLRDITEGGTKIITRILVLDPCFLKGQPLLRFDDGTIYHTANDGFVSGPIQNLLMNVLDTPIQHLPFLVYTLPD